MIIDKEDFDKWYKENCQFYDHRNIEDFADMIEDYTKYKETDIKEQ